jgi:Ca2+/Na+ antiporter
VHDDILNQNDHYSNNLVLVLMDNHVQVCEMMAINKVIVAYVRYLLQIKKSSQTLYDRRRTAALL